MTDRSLKVHGSRRKASRVARKAHMLGSGLLAQACSAATNFALVVLAGHRLGPGGLGTLLIGFSAYMVLLGLLRALLTEPLVAVSSSRGRPEKALGARAALTLALVASVVAAGLLAALGFVLPTPIADGMLLFAPWLAPALVQDLGRSIVFRDWSGWGAPASDAAWLLTMIAAAPFALTSRSAWVVVACWGVGSVSGAGLALWQLRWRPVGPGRAVTWWKVNAWPFARWLGVQALLYSVVTYATVLLLAEILGSRDYGGLRAVQSVFAPLSLLGPALALPGLPLVSRLVVVARKRALSVAAQIAALITVVTGAYVGVLYAFPQALVFFFGPGFAQFDSIIIPIGLGQILAAPLFGLTLFLKAEQRGRTLLWLGTLNAVVYLVLTVALGSQFGLSGAAWAAVGYGAASAIALIVIFRPSTW